MRVIVFLVQCTEGVCASVLIARDLLDYRPKEHLLIGCYLCEAIDSQLSRVQLNTAMRRVIVLIDRLVNAVLVHSSYAVDVEDGKS